MKKQLVTAGLAAAVGVTGLIGVGVANAAPDTNTRVPMTSLVQTLASKFNLKEAEVQAVFDAQHDKMEAEREAELKQAVSQLVTDGKITQDQADKINAKRLEIEKEREAAKDSGKTRAGMKTEMQAKRTELETWAKDNGIDVRYLHYVMGGEHGHGRGEHASHRDNDTDGSTTQ